MPYKGAVEDVLFCDGFEAEDAVEVLLVYEGREEVEPNFYEKGYFEPTDDIIEAHELADSKGDEEHGDQDGEEGKYVHQDSIYND